MPNRRHVKYDNTRIAKLMRIGRLLGNALKLISDKSGNVGSDGSDGMRSQMVDVTSTVYSFTS